MNQQASLDGDIIELGVASLETKGFAGMPRDDVLGLPAAGLADE